MSRPLELLVYPRVECGSSCNCISYVLPGGDYMGIEGVSITTKRFTEAELAAEVYRACYEFKVAHEIANLIPCPETWSNLDRDVGWMYAMERFATLPNYDEVAA